MSASPPRTLCLGDALVDLVGERPGVAADRGRPLLAAFRGCGGQRGAGRGAGRGPGRAGRRGRRRRLGALAARSAAPRHGSTSATSRSSPGVQTPLAFVTVDADGEPSYHLHGEQPELSCARVGRAAGGGGRRRGGAVHLHQHAGRQRRAGADDASPRADPRARSAGRVRRQPPPAPLALAHRRGGQRQRLRPRRAAGAGQPRRGRADDRGARPRAGRAGARQGRRPAGRSSRSGPAGAILRGSLRATVPACPAGRSTRPGRATR